MLHAVCRKTFVPKELCLQCSKPPALATTHQQMLMSLLLEPRISFPAASCHQQLLLRLNQQYCELEETRLANA
jgi:hypothetical protein